MSSMLFPLRAEQDSGLDLIHRMQEALGGADKIAAIRDLEWIVKADTFDRERKPIGQVTKRTRWIRPNYLRVDQVGPGDTYVLCFDGRSGWEILPGTTSTVELAGGELEFAEGYLSGFMLNLWVADRSTDSTITSPAPNVIRVSSKKNTNDIAVNPQTGLPAQVVEWINVQGVQFPARLLNSHKDEGSADIRTEKVAFNVGLTPVEIAAKPSDGKPVLAGR